MNAFIWSLIILLSIISIVVIVGFYLRSKKRSELLRQRKESPLEAAWRRAAEAQGVTVKALRDRLHQRVGEAIERIASERGVSVETMRLQLATSLILLNAGPSCITADEYQALLEGRDLAPDRLAHAEGCRACGAVRAALNELHA